MYMGLKLSKKKKKELRRENIKHPEHIHSVGKHTEFWTKFSESPPCYQDLEPAPCTLHRKEKSKGLI